jgi:hypothetical protein
MKKFRIIIAILLVSSLSFGVLNSDLFANFNKFKIKDVEVETTADSVAISWGNHVAEQYVISLDGKKYSTGKEESITISDLQADHPYEITIEAHDGEKVTDKIVIQTITDSEENQVDTVNDLDDGKTTAIFTENEAKIHFENVPDDDKVYTVKRDNEELGTLRGNKNFLIDTDLKPDTSYRYSLVGKMKLNKKEKEKVKQKIKEKNLSPNLVDIEELDKEYELTRTIKTLKETKENSAHAESWSDPSPGAEFIYSTFIPMDVFTFAPPGVEKITNYHRFHGDGRGFDEHVLSDDFRTRTWLRVSFPPSGGSKVRFKKDYNPTSGQHKKTKEWVTANTSMSKVYLESKSEGSTKATFTVNHEAGNPLHNVKSIPAPEIDYRYSGEVYKSGYFQINGIHDRAPNHEMSFTPVPGEVHTWGGQVQYSTMNHLLTDKIGNWGFYELIGPPIYGQKSFSVQGYWK